MAGFLRFSRPKLFPLIYIFYNDVIEYILIFALNNSGKGIKMPDGLEQCRKVVVKPLYFAALIILCRR